MGGKKKYIEMFGSFAEPSNIHTIHKYPFHRNRNNRQCEIPC